MAPKPAAAAAPPAAAAAPPAAAGGSVVHKALLVGCNYPGTSAELRGCINDVWGMKKMLMENYKFEESNITIMIDTDDQYVSPTGKNIKDKLRNLVAGATPGSALVFHFSGHGTQIPGEEDDGKDEAICPTDMNVILDDDFRGIFKPLHKDVKFTFVADCCHSGTLLDHHQVHITGDKDGNTAAAPAGGLDMGQLAGMFGLKGLPGGAAVGSEGVKNRAIPFTQYLQLMASKYGLKDLKQGNVRSGMKSVFGSDASSSAIKYVDMLNNFLSKKTRDGSMPGGKHGKTLASIVSKLLGCLKKQQAAAGGAAAGGAAPGEPNLPIKTGQKPPTTEQLGEDKGILISGCQSHETSADACPSGDAAQAYGALSNGIQTVLKAQAGKPITYRQLVSEVRKLLGTTGFKQNPCLEGTEANADKPFIL